jgi:hypothetical protein
MEKDAKYIFYKMYSCEINGIYLILMAKWTSL